MSAAPVTLRTRVSTLATRLDAPHAHRERDALKSELIELVRAIDRETSELAALKNDLKGLAARWKAIPTATADVVPPTTPARLHADHLGASTFVEKGWGCISAGDYPGAETALLRALALSPGDAHAESLLGWSQMHQEKYDEALLSFQKVLMREPGNALARMNVGYICLKKGIFGEAIEHLSKAIRLDNDRKAALYAHFYLGLVYLEREMYDDAQAFFEKTVALGPNLIEAYYELGRARWFGGHAERAREAWRQGAAANKFNAWAKRCAAMLDAVEAGQEPPRAA